MCVHLQNADAIDVMETKMILVIHIIKTEIIIIISIVLQGFVLKW